MKTCFSLFFIFFPFIGAVSIVHAVDIRSDSFIDFMLNYKEAGKPETFEDAVVFTAPSFYKSVGISFAHENFSKIYWFKRMLVPIDDTVHFDPQSKIPRELLKDSGILFYAWSSEGEARELEYRLVIDGIWSADPLNPQKRRAANGLELSYVKAPPKTRIFLEEASAKGVLSINYKAAPGETIMLAGDFNGWDPFMYQLKEISSGVYSINLPLPKGTWRYALFSKGRRLLDPRNLNRVWEKDGTGANIIDIE